MFIKIIIFILLIIMLYNLFKAMQSMAKNDPGKKQMSHFIGRRVLFSSLVLLFIIIAIVTGAITPNPRPY